MERYSPFFLVAFLFLVILSCKHKPELPSPGTNDTIQNPPPPNPDTGKKCSPDTVYFQNEVLPLIVSTCAKSGCHDMVTQEQGVILTDWSTIVNTGEVVPGDPGNSKIYEMITDTEDDRMPPFPANPMTSTQIAMIAKWINQGALNNKCDSLGCDTSNVTYTNTINPIVQTFCLGCHSGGNPANGLNLGGYDAVKTAAQGRLMGAIRHEAGYKPMPPGGSLSSCQISEFQIWINHNFPQ